MITRCILALDALQLGAVLFRLGFRQVVQFHAVRLDKGAYALLHVTDPHNEIISLLKVLAGDLFDHSFVPGHFTMQLLIELLYICHRLYYSITGFQCVIISPPIF